MPSLLRPAAGLLLAALALVLVVCWPALAGAPASIEVTIVKPDGTSKAILADEADDDLSGIYKVRQPNGSIVDVDATGGVSIYSLLRKAGATLDYETVEIPRPGGGTLTLTRKAVESSDPRPPGIFKDDTTGKTMFIGFPPTGARYVEAGDYFEIASSTFQITQIGKAEVSVKVKASRTKIEPGESVKFTATATPKGSYRYDWTLEPGVSEKDAGSTITHRYKKAGTYSVVVGVYTSDDDGDSDSGQIKIQVGDPKKSDKDREGGGDNTASGAPDSGASTGSSGAGSPYDDGSSGYTPTPYTPSTPVPSTPSTPTPSTPDPAPDTAISGTPVTGNLLADVSDPPPSNILESAARAARDGNPKDGDEGGGVPEAALSIAGVLALLGLGAGIENRQGRLPRPRLPLPRRAA